MDLLVSVKNIEIQIVHDVIIYAAEVETILTPFCIRTRVEYQMHDFVIVRYFSNSKKQCCTENSTPLFFVLTGSVSVVSAEYQMHLFSGCFWFSHSSARWNSSLHRIDWFQRGKAQSKYVHTCRLFSSISPPRLRLCLRLRNPPRHSVEDMYLDLFP